MLSELDFQLLVGIIIANLIFMNGQPMIIDFQKLKRKVVRMLSMHSSPKLGYHNVKHTLDVLEHCERIALAEGIDNKEQLLQLRIAALYHDSGFLYVYQNHEEKSCEIAQEDLRLTGVDKKTLKGIFSLIMATKVPQTPKTHLEKILCDADLDYLGRDDFDSISNALKKELFDFGFVKSEGEWNELQIKFLESHQYFTKTANATRTFKKTKNLERLKLNGAAIISSKTL